MADIDAKDASHSALKHRLGFFLLAAIIGAVVGLSTLLLIELVLLVQWLGYGEASEIHFTQILSTRPAWQVVLVPAVGGLVIGIVVQFLPSKRYHGIGDVMEACALNSARMPARSGIGAALATGVSLGVGAPLGREGPAVHIGASISAYLAERLKLDHKQSLALLGCGAAAAVAVSFNTPLAAVIFALEVVVGYYTLRVFAPIVIATVLAMLVRYYFLGNEPLFPVLPHVIESGWEFLLFALLGVLGALLGKSLLFIIGYMQEVWVYSKAPGWIKPALAGLLMGMVATQLPMVMGMGYEGTLLALRGALPSDLLLYLMLAKMLVVALALSSGFAGGVFGPSLFLGSMMGGLFWALISLTGVSLSEPDVYATIGMAAVSSALLGAPISTVLIMFELTRDYDITLGVMTAAAFASTVMQIGEHGSFFRWQLAKRQINLSRGRDISLLMTHKVQSLVNDDYLLSDSDLTVGELSARMGSQRQRVVVFKDDDGVFVGSASLSMIVAYSIEAGMDAPAIEAAIGANYSINIMTNIVTAVQNMAEREHDYIPVLDRSDSEKPTLLGVVSKSDLLSEHYDVVKRAREDEFGIT